MIVIIPWGGIASCSIGTVFFIAARASGRNAKLLKQAREFEQLSDLSQVEDALPLVVAVRGSTRAVDSLEAGHSGEKGVIHETIVEQHYMQRAEQRDWVRDSAIVSHVVREVPWYLVRLYPRLDLDDSALKRFRTPTRIESFLLTHSALASTEGKHGGVTLSTMAEGK
ncbi:hypothetical protein CYMTET_18975 [Cymbomonas tetramitiformis]|uniref:Uncharacterized protein n=1 Tax=Cymbomonas tetramitiformis TaxID=36881 RepID=A0AAE0G734_9CHLO|nr:hypothetical protein CYMTET_18975 [Cymbomonas tetramitiformis]